jgi:toxin ParE1/3/4
MRIVFRAAALSDLAWFQRYYSQIFPEGEKAAKAQLQALYANLTAHPLIGHPNGRIPGVREFHVTRTPFTLVYRIDGDDIIVLRLIDNRAPRPDMMSL